VDNFETLMPLLSAMFDEFQAASKKKPDAVINTKKVEIVNRLLTDVLLILDGEPMRPYLDTLSKDDLPQNSDVVLVLGQIVTAMKAFRSKYRIYSSVAGQAYWYIENGEEYRVGED
jgi:hypothetical protein